MAKITSLQCPGSVVDIRLYMCEELKQNVWK